MVYAFLTRTHHSRERKCILTITSLVNLNKARDRLLCTRAQTHLHRKLTSCRWEEQRCRSKLFARFKYLNKKERRGKKARECGRTENQSVCIGWDHPLLPRPVRQPRGRRIESPSRVWQTVQTPINAPIYDLGGAHTKKTGLFILCVFRPPIPLNFLKWAVKEHLKITRERFPQARSTTTRKGQPEEHESL